MVRRPVIAAFGVCGLALALVLSAAPQSSSPETTFTSNSELVLVPVQVMDHGGQPLRGLTKDAFVLESDGQPQQIAVFDEVRRSTQVMIPTHKAEPATAPASFSNLPSDGVPHELVILAIDRLNTIGVLQRWSRDQLVTYVRQHPPQEPTALVMIAPDGLLEFQGPTWDGESLIQALQRIHVQGDMFSPVLTPNLRTSFHGRPGEYAMMMADLDQKRQAQLALSLGAIRNTLRSFEQIAKAYSAVPGRKTVLWFTSGFPALDLEPEAPPLFGKPGPPHPAPVTSLRHMGKELLPEFQQAFAALNRANVVLYPVDVTAFGGDRLWNAWDDLPSSGPGFSPFAGITPAPNSPIPGNATQLGTAPSFGSPGALTPFPANPTQPAWQPPFAGGFCGAFSYGGACWAGGGSDYDVTSGWLNRIGEKVVARSTGGEPCTAGNHVEHCIEKAEAESNGYYLLGFYVPQQLRKPGWHELKVQVAGDHGPVRTRSGYYLEVQGPAPKEPDTHSIDDAIVAALEYTGVVFKVEPGKWDAGDGTVPFRLSVSGGNMITLPGEDKLSFDVVSVPISAHGIPIPGAGRISKVAMDRAATEKALGHGWTLIDQANAPKTAVAVKVVLRDNVTRRIGSVVFPLADHPANASWRASKNRAVLLLNNSGN